MREALRAMEADAPPAGTCSGLAGSKHRNARSGDSDSSVIGHASDRRSLYSLARQKRPVPSTPAERSVRPLGEKVHVSANHENRRSEHSPHARHERAVSRGFPNVGTEKRLLPGIACIGSRLAAV